jgi:hypothetical protein
LVLLDHFHPPLHSPRPGEGFHHAWATFIAQPACGSGDRQARRRVKQVLRHPAVTFDGHQALRVAHGFARMAAKADYQIYACSILPEHVTLCSAGICTAWSSWCGC